MAYLKKNLTKLKNNTDIYWFLLVFTDFFFFFYTYYDSNITFFEIDCVICKNRILLFDQNTDKVILMFNIIRIKLLTNLRSAAKFVYNLPNAD